MITKQRNLTLITIAASFLAQSSFAQTMQTKDLWFLPIQGQFMSTTGMDVSSSETEIDTSGTPKLKGTGLVLSQSLLYAIGNELHIGADVSFSSEKSETLTGATTKKSESSSGIEDPSLSLSYRLMKQDDSKLFLDLGLDVSPSLGKSKTSNVLRGSTEISFSAELGQSIGAFEYAIAPGFIYYTDEKSEGTTVKSRFDFALAAGTQYDFNETVALNTGLGLLFPGKRAEKNTSDEVKFDYSFVLLVGPSFQILENLSTDVTLSYVYGSGEVTSSGSSVDIKSRGLGLGASLDYVF